MVRNHNCLITRNSRERVQVVLIDLEQLKGVFTIKRITFQFGGKKTIQPEITIEEGKAKRTPLQQAELEYASHIKKYCDKGYKNLTDYTGKPFEEFSEQELLSFLPANKTDANGNEKPQLAKSSNDCASSIFEKEWYCSRKLDGVRSHFKLRNGLVHTVSRGGKTYDGATKHLRENPKLIEFFESNPDIILDGELYHHGINLQKLSGTARLDEWEDRCSILQYWIYDIADESKTFEERLVELKKLQEFFKDEIDIKVIDHIKLSGYSTIKKQHDKWVGEGYEGLVMRKPNAKYKFGKRTSDWVKLKEYKDAEFEITGIADGLRPEDMCFVLVTEEGKEFKAKPIGDRDLKAEYLDNWKDYVGKLATVKFFAWSDEKIPTQPVLKSIRLEEDM